jgi:hypothetical protein
MCRTESHGLSVSKERVLHQRYVNIKLVDGVADFVVSGRFLAFSAMNNIAVGLAYSSRDSSGFRPSSERTEDIIFFLKIQI